MAIVTVGLSSSSPHCLAELAVQYPEYAVPVRTDAAAPGFARNPFRHAVSTRTSARRVEPAVRMDAVMPGFSAATPEIVLPMAQNAARMEVIATKDYTASYTTAKLLAARIFRAASIASLEVVPTTQFPQAILPHRRLSLQYPHPPP